MPAVRRPLLLLSLLLLGACTTEEPAAPYCPQGFDDDIEAPTADGYCSLGSYAEAIEADRGVYGFVKSIAGGCGPGDNACSVTYEDAHPVEIYAVDEVLTVEDCRNPPPDTSDDASPIDGLDVAPILVVNTDDQGRYWTSLEPGTYCVSSIDTIDDSRWATVVTVDEDLTNATFVFDHGFI